MLLHILYTKVEKICTGQMISDWQTDRRTDGHIDHYRSPAERDVLNFTIFGRGPKPTPVYKSCSLLTFTILLSKVECNYPTKIIGSFDKRKKKWALTEKDKKKQWHKSFVAFTTKIIRSFYRTIKQNMSCSISTSQSTNCMWDKAISSYNIGWQT